MRRASSTSHKQRRNLNRCIALDPDAKGLDLVVVADLARREHHHLPPEWREHRQKLDEQARCSDDLVQMNLHRPTWIIFP